MIRAFHCDAGEYGDLKDRLAKDWILCNWVFSRGEWHITAIKRKFFESLPHEKRERVMARLTYANKGECNGQFIEHRTNECAEQSKG